MGLFFKSDPVSTSEQLVKSAEEAVRRNEAYLSSMKDSRKQAKQNGNYQRTAKNYRNNLGNNEVGTVYDANVWSAERNLKKAKEDLKKAKERLAAAKKK